MNPGDVIAERYAIEHLAGEGGMGAVYRARDLRTHEPVALKVLRAVAAREGDRFEREARVLAELRHAGIVRYVDHGATADGQQFLAMAWLEGEDLDARLARRALTVREAVRLAARAADALGYAHSRGVVHRDVKPSNLFLPDGDIDRVTVLDFGIARLGNAARAATRTGVLLGTPGYIAPEQARGTRAVDARADVFALGCVLYECLAGRPAFAGEHVMAVLAKILLEPAPRVAEVEGAPAIPVALDALLGRMLDKDPEGRPADGAAVAAALRAIEATLDPAAAAATATFGTEPPPPLMHPDTTASPELAPRAEGEPRRPVLTASEQRLMSVVLVGSLHAQDAAAASEPLALTTPTQAPTETTEVLRTVVGLFRGRLEHMADGSMVVTVESAGSATDQAAQTARCALAMRGILPWEPMAVATGRGQVAGRLPVGEVIDRAVAMVRRPVDVETTLDALAGVRPIRLDELTAGLLDARFAISGDAAGLELRGERDVAEAARTLLGRPSPCVGRERELAALEAIWRECVAESVARAVVLVAPAGVGKSRVRYEFVRKLERAAAPGAEPQVWLARTDPMTAGSPFGLIAQVIRREAGLAEGEPAHVRYQKLRARAGRRLAPADAARVAEFFAEMVGAPATDEAASVALRAARRDALLMGDQLRRAFEDWLEAECRARPVLLVLEDLHWGDYASVRFVDGALRRLADLPFMVLALARPEVKKVFPDLWRGRPLTELALGELTRKGAERLVRQMLAGEEADEATVARIVALSGGNAFYLEELIRAVAEGDHGGASPGGERPAPLDALPSTVLAMAQARLEALDPDVRRTLRAASVFGQVFWHGGLHALLGGGGRSTLFADSLATLCERELIEKRGDTKFPGQTEYVFRHALLREAAYAMLTDHDRALGHKLAGEWLERAGESDPAVVAEHFERGREPARAVQYYRRAAEQALEGNDFTATVRHAERGLRCGAAGEARGALRLLEGEARLWRGELEATFRCSEEALALLPPESATWYKAAGGTLLLATNFGLTARFEPLVETLRAGRPHGEAAAEQAMAWSLAAWMAEVVGRFELAEAFLGRLAKVEPLVRDSNPAGEAWVHLARSFWARLVEGDAGAALDAAERAHACFASVGDARNASQAAAQIGAARLCLGDAAGAERALGAVVERSRAEGLSFSSAVALALHAWALALLGRHEAAREAAAAGVAIAAAQGSRYLEGTARDYLAMVCARAGALDAALDAARAAVELLAATPPTHAHALATRASVELLRGDAPGALRTAREAAGVLSSLERLGEFEPAVRLAHARALAACGETAAARAEARAAAELVDARAARLAGDAAARARFLREVPEHAEIAALARAFGD